MDSIGSLETIRQALASLAQQPLDEGARALWAALGYRSERRHPLPTQPTAFVATLREQQRELNAERARLDEWESVHFLFQLTGEEVAGSLQMGLQFEAPSYQSAISSYLFVAVGLRGAGYSRTQLAAITREINKLFPMPVMLLFRYGAQVTLALIDRRPHRRDESRDVLEKVTLIKDIRPAAPHRAHLDILHDLALPTLAQTKQPATMDALHEAWKGLLDSSELNKRFFKELADWYFWALNHVTFPAGAEPDEAIRNATSVIRLLTRLIFVWFLKEKGLVPEALFDTDKLRGLLHTLDDDESSYYKAILQNLFFATLNQEMNEPGQPPVRRFRTAPPPGQYATDYKIHTLYRYEPLFRDPQAALALFETIPFLNGGLFECLDRQEPGETKQRVDGFSDRADNPLRVPNFLFFRDCDPNVDLNAAYGTKNRSSKVRGLLHIFNRYKFTIEENTPLEEEIALDPELLGRVFENLLAAYNPETNTTARKQTGSFYTPRTIVNYMVEETLIAYLARQMAHGRVVDEAAHAKMEASLRRLFAYEEGPHGLSGKGVTHLIALIDRLKILDPACGSGAFPMGILHKLVFVLGKLDPRNERWKEEQIAKAQEIDVASARDEAIQAIEEAFERNELDYARKLYLIENGIYGVDIQTVAVQIAKLRCFISLIVDQRVDDARPNRGIRPLPNLETKIVAANTLFDVQHSIVKTGKQAAAMQGLFQDPAIQALEGKLRAVRRQMFRARSRASKLHYRKQDEALRQKIADELVRGGFPTESSLKLARWDPYDQTRSADYFDPEWMFGIPDGFDIVIGNPPYVRQEKLRDIKPALQAQYERYTGTADLYIYFYERGLHLLKPGGVLCYISSNKYFRAAYGEKLRAFLAGQTTLQQVVDFGDAPVFTAIAYPSILLLRKQPPGDNRVRALTWQPGPPIEEFPARFRADSFELPQTALSADGWRLEGGTVRRLLQTIRAAGTPLGEYVKGRLYYGIKTGLNEAFVVDRATRDRLVAEHPASAEILKPFLRGRDVKRWRVEFAEQYLIFTRRGIQIEEYPAILNYLLPFKLRLTPGIPGGRKAGPYKWFEVQDPIAYWPEFEQPKIIIPAITNTVNYAPDFTGYYSNNKTTICIPPSVPYTLAICNSSVAWWFAQQVHISKQGGFYDFEPRYSSQLPIPQADAQQQGLIEALCNALIAQHAGGHAADAAGTAGTAGTAETQDFASLLNGLVYELYFPDLLRAANLSLFALLPATLPATPDAATLHRLRDDPALRATLAALKDLEAVRIIEGLGDGG